MATLLKRLDAIKLALGHASELSELVQNSILAECHKTSLIKALSASSCKAVSQKGGKRDHQFLLSGFLNYLTQTEKEALRDDSKHAFTRCSIPVARCMKIELFMPCEKTYGHVLATLIEHFQMAGTAKEANDLLVEFKRLLRRARGDKTPSLLHYPADPRELPANLFQAAYTNATELDAAQSANCKPGKWLRASSKDLQEMVVPFQGHGSMRAGQMNFMQQQMLMQQHLQQMQLLHRQQQQGDLWWFFPRRGRAWTTAMLLRLLCSLGRVVLHSPCRTFRSAILLLSQTLVRLLLCHLQGQAKRSKRLQRLLLPIKKLMPTSTPWMTPSMLEVTTGQH